MSGSSGVLSDNAAVLPWVLMLLVIAGVVFYFNYQHQHTLKRMEQLDVAMNSQKKRLTGVTEAMDSSVDSRLMQLLLVKHHSLTMNPHFKTMSDRLTLAFALRNHIYTQTPLKGTPPQYQFNQVYQTYVDAVLNPEIGHICAGHAIVYRIVLEAYGIPSREVLLYSKITEGFHGHNTVEIYVEPYGWVASDPTYNIALTTPEGQYLGYSEAFERYQNNRGAEVLFDTHGYELLHRKNLKEYPVSLEEMAQYVIIGPSVLHQSEIDLQQPIIHLPETWDGFVEGKDINKSIGNPNLKTIKGFLNAGPLR